MDFLINKLELQNNVAKIFITNVLFKSRVKKCVLLTCVLISRKLHTVFETNGKCMNIYRKLNCILTRNDFVYLRGI